jgi:hypothetical protein
MSAIFFSARALNFSYNSPLYDMEERDPALFLRAETDSDIKGLPTLSGKVCGNKDIFEHLYFLLLVLFLVRASA